MLPDELAVAGLALGGLLLALAVVALGLSARYRRLHGIEGDVVYSDTGAGRVQAKPLYATRYGLTGKPDYLIRTRQGLVPVEVKPGRTDPEPQESHLLQVLAYCLLLEDSEGKAPPYGLLRYRDDTFKVDYNSRTRAYILDVLDEMKEARKLVEVHRNHEQPGRCRACAYREVCDEDLTER
ncbi:MAG: CRISPR-associated protein Cas4 [Chloroflexia bacterium]